MPLRKQHPVRFSPRGLSDADDATDVFAGASKSLSNLIFDSGNPEVVICRPGVVQMTDFTTAHGGINWNTPTFLSVHICIGTVIYGMVSTARNPGYDEPFAYNVSTGTFTAVTNVLAGNVPASPATTGAWVPPTMAMVGTKILVTHPGFSGTGNNVATGATSSIAGTVLTVGGAVVGTFLVGMTITGIGVTANTIITSYSSGSGGAGTYNVSQTSAVGPIAVTGTIPANFFGVIDVSVPATPVWNSLNTQSTATTGPASDGALPTVPTSVANFNNRAYFSCAQIDYFSDVLNPTVRTAASQSLTIGDSTPVIAQCGLPVQTTSGGVLQSLLIFKESQIWQVTGDLALTTLSLNYVSLTVGTKMPRSVVQTPKGVNFIATDGPYYVDTVGAVHVLTHDPAGIEHELQDPFIYASVPSRAAAGYNTSIYRICLNTVIDGIEQLNDYWFDTNRRHWNGPHTWPVDCVSQVGNYTAVSHSLKGAKLFKSQVTYDYTSVYLDNGSLMTFSLESSTLPKDATMTEKQVIESTIELSTSGASVSYLVTAINDQGTPLCAVTVITPAAGYLWGNFNWGAGYWSGLLNKLKVYNIPWTNPLVFQKMAIVVQGTVASNIRIGSFFARYQDCGYTNMG